MMSTGRGISPAESDPVGNRALNSSDDQLMYCRLISIDSFKSGGKVELTLMRLCNKW